MNSLPTAVMVAAGWAAYFFLHSLLASPAAKRVISGRWPAAQRYYRLAYNAAAALLLAPLLWAVLRLPSPELWSFSGWRGWLADAAAVAAVAGFLWTTRYYSMAEFTGTDQWHRGTNHLRTQFVISPLHRFVRHPWYTLGLVILWSRDMDVLRLVSAVMISGYLILGSRLEERKLVKELGEAYQEYRRRVPGLIPLPWRYLTRNDAVHLLARYRHPFTPSGS